MSGCAGPKILSRTSKAWKWCDGGTFHSIQCHLLEVPASSYCQGLIWFPLGQPHFPPVKKRFNICPTLTFSLGNYLKGVLVGRDGGLDEGFGDDKDTVFVPGQECLRAEKCHSNENSRLSSCWEVSSKWGLSSCCGLSSWHVWLGRTRKNIASVITLHTKSLPLSILLPLSVAVKQLPLSLVHGQCHAFGKSVVKRTRLQIFPFSPTFFFCFSVGRDIAAIWTMI